MDDETYITVAEDALNAGNFKSGTLSALISLAMSQDKIAESLVSIDLKLERVVNNLARLPG